jgi:hypothetical protein
MTKEQDPNPDPIVRGIDPLDTDPHQNVMDPEHRKKEWHTATKPLKKG